MQRLRFFVARETTPPSRRSARGFRPQARVPAQAEERSCVQNEFASLNFGIKCAGKAMSMRTDRAADSSKWSLAMRLATSRTDHRKVSVSSSRYLTSCGGVTTGRISPGGMPRSASVRPGSAVARAKRGERIARDDRLPGQRLLARSHQRQQIGDGGGGGEPGTLDPARVQRLVTGAVRVPSQGDGGALAGYRVQPDRPPGHRQAEEQPYRLRPTATRRSSPTPERTPRSAPEDRRRPRARLRGHARQVCSRRRSRPRPAGSNGPRHPTAGCPHRAPRRPPGRTGR